jgi:peptidyl-prolyl cis-trans isomerase SurA
MKLKIILPVLAFIIAAPAVAQTEQDPVIMKINGMPVTRSEFEYSYNKNNSEGVIDKKTVEEYIDLFINYKLKVLAAESEQMDTLSSFKNEFATYRDQQIRPAMITDEDVENEAKKIYAQTQHRIDSMGGLVKPAHILVLVRQTATDAEMAAAKAKADSLYNVLKKASFDKEVFSDLAKRYSDDKGSVNTGGELAWIQKGQTLKEFNDKVFSMKKGETSEPVKTAAGFHIIQLRDKGMFFPYDSLRTNILNFIEQRGLKNHIINQRLDSLAKAKGPDVTPDMILEKKREQMEAEDPNLKYLIQEYHDGLLLYEISNRNIWEKASKDEAGLAKFFKKNKKKYAWDAPRFKGIAYRTKELSDIEAVKAAVKDLPFDKWNETLRSTFNKDSVLRIRAEKGVFKKGDNAIVDKYEFKTDTTIKEMKGYPYTATYGKIIKKPEDYTDVKGFVVADYQEMLEKEWVAELRKKYSVEVDKSVVATVNKH